MAKRLSKIVTRTGDSGTTGLGDGTRVAKNDARIEAIGTVDELNSWVGLLAAEVDEDDDLKSLLLDVLKGTGTELDYINGYLCSEALRRNIDVPEHRALLHELRELVPS